MISTLIATIILFASFVTAMANNEQYDMEYYSKFKDKGISINVYNWGEYISNGSDDLMDVNEEFEKITGIDVVYTQYATNEEMYSKLKMGAVSYDIVFPSDYMAARMIKEDMLLPLNYDNIPNSKNINEKFTGQDYDSTDNYTLPYTWGTVGIIYNKTMVDTKIDSWDDLWDSHYSKNILMFKNPRDAFGISLIRNGHSINTENKIELDQAADELKKQKPIVQAYVMDQIFDKMQGGEAAIAPYYAGDAITMIESNPDLAFAFPKEGTNIFIDVIGIPTSAKNKEAAEMYINFLNEPNVACENIQYICYSTPNKAAFELLDDETKQNKIAYPSSEVLDKATAFAHLSNDTNKYLDKLWTDILSANNSYNEWVMPLFVIGGLSSSIAIILLKKRHKRKKFNAYKIKQ